MTQMKDSQVVFGLRQLSSFANAQDDKDLGILHHSSVMLSEAKHLAECKK